MANVLVIDDEAEVCETVRRMLERAGHDVITASSGREGLAALEASPVDLVVTDIRMPNVDGMEVIMSLSRAGDGLPVIAISGGGLLSKEILLASASMLGAVEIVPKPFRTSDLLDAVERALENPEN